MKAIGEALKAWVAAATELDEGLVVFENEERPHMGDAYALLSFGPIQPIGIDWTREELVDDQLIPTRIGYRELVVNVSLEVHSQELDENAVFLGELLRTRGGLEELRADAKAAANLVLVELQEAQVSDYEVDERMISRVIVPTRWRTVSVIQEPTKPRDYIARVEVGSTFNK